MITGEPLPVTRLPGDTVIGGTINQDGRLIVRVTKIGAETALAQIVQLVETRQSSKPPVQQLADQIAAVFVPTVLVIALVTAIGWYAVGAQASLDRGPQLGGHRQGGLQRADHRLPVCAGAGGAGGVMVGTGRGRSAAS